jgi:hypothetical protein
MKNIIKISILVFSFVLINRSYSQSAVYYCTSTGVYGYAYETSDCQSLAYNYCKQSGGINPQLVGVVNSKGYGAIAIGKNSYGFRVIGASAGCNTLSEAKRNAKKFCRNYGGNYNVYIAESWNDPEDSDESDDSEE